MSPQSAYLYALSINVQPIYMYHGTSKQNYKLIKKYGFRADFNTTNTITNFFTWSPRYAETFAKTFAENGIILVCQITLSNPMPYELFENIWVKNSNDKKSKLLKNKLLEHVKLNNYDGLITPDEIWVWNPKSVIIIGKFLPFKKSN